MYPNLRAEMARKKITSEMLAEVLNINPATMSAKLNKKERLRLSEARKIYNHFFSETDFCYLFETEDKEESNERITDF